MDMRSSSGWALANRTEATSQPHGGHATHSYITFLKSEHLTHDTLRRHALEQVHQVTVQKQHPWNVKVMFNGSGQAYLLFTALHCVADEVSGQIFLSDLLKAYGKAEEQAGGQEPPRQQVDTLPLLRPAESLCPRSSWIVRVLLRVSLQYLMKRNFKIMNQSRFPGPSGVAGQKTDVHVAMLSSEQVEKLQKVATSKAVTLETIIHTVHLCMRDRLQRYPLTSTTELTPVKVPVDTRLHLQDPSDLANHIHSLLSIAEVPLSLNKNSPFWSTAQSLHQQLPAATKRGLVYPQLLELFGRQASVCGSFVEHGSMLEDFGASAYGPYRGAVEGGGAKLSELWTVGRMDQVFGLVHVWVNVIPGGCLCISLGCRSAYVPEAIAKQLIEQWRAVLEKVADDGICDKTTVSEVFGGTNFVQ